MATSTRRTETLVGFFLFVGLAVRGMLVMQFGRFTERFRGGYTDRKSTRLNSSHVVISYAAFCLKKKTNDYTRLPSRARLTSRQ